MEIQYNNLVFPFVGKAGALLLKNIMCIFILYFWSHPKSVSCDAFSQSESVNFFEECGFSVAA